MIGYTFHAMNMSQLALWFFIYSFCGWAMECVVIRIQLGRWENRGFAKLPFCVIYGFGVFIAYHLFQPIEHNYVALYIWGCIAATIFEYLTAQVMLRLFDEVWWDYTHKKINYKGILCLQSTKPSRAPIFPAKTTSCSSVIPCPAVSKRAIARPASN